MHMQDGLRQRFLWRRTFPMVVTILMIVPALFFSSFIYGTAQAHSLASHVLPPNHVTVSPAVKHDVSPPLRSIKPVHTAAAKQRPLLHLPNLPQGVPNGLGDNVQNHPARKSLAIPSPSNNFDGVGMGFS